MKSKGRRLITSDLNPDEIYPMPADNDFIYLPDRIDAVPVENEYLLSSPIESLSLRLIEECVEFEDLRGTVNIQYFWKREGGKKDGKYTFGKCVKTSGFTRFYSQAHFLIWLAYDHCRLFNFTRYMVEALAFHELKHARMKASDAGLIAALRPHDQELFTDEYKRFGAWRPDLLLLEQAVQQRFNFEPQPHL